MHSKRDGACEEQIFAWQCTSGCDVALFSQPCDLSFLVYWSLERKDIIWSNDIFNNPVNLSKFYSQIVQTNI
jgi:hypothetical protein